MQKHRVRKAVIPAAGLGTRFLPATKSMPKEMLPVVDKPVLQFVVEEAIQSGIEDILIITGRGKQAIENHFDFNLQLEALLSETGRSELREAMRSIGEHCHIHYIRQKRQLGLGDAVRLARWHVGQEPFAVMLGDSIVEPAPGAPPGLRQLIDIHAARGTSVVSVREVPLEWVARYGIVDGPLVEGMASLRRLDRLVEKPLPDKAPSRWAIAGRYVFTAGIFDCIDETTAGIGGEIQLTDAMNLLATREEIFALNWRAHRYDIGNRLEYAKCFFDYALRRDDIGNALREHVEATLKER
jgi:UTP--glucose-1-phosphate uridylyltransferase